ncbi:MAG TPA: PAS domain S-box protein [Chitinophagales bacterium]|nr:PAS domain S-box protein [Chitinophagales bacterium]
MPKLRKTKVPASPLHAKSGNASNMTERFFSQLIKAAAEGIILVDSRGRIMMLNPRCEKMFRYREKELVGKPVEILIPDRFKTKHRYHRQKYIKKPRTRPMGIGMDLFGMRKDGTEFPIEVGLSSFNFEGEKITAAFITDTTLRRQAQETARLLADVVRSSDVFIAGVSKDGKILSWNKGAEKLYGYREKEILGMPISILAPKWLKGEILSLYERVMKGERIENYETTRVTKDGNLKEMSITISPRKDAAGNIVGASTIARDITQAKQMQAALQKEKETLQQYLDIAGVVFLVLDKKGNVKLINKKGCEILGYAENEILGKNWVSNFLPDSIKKEITGLFHSIVTERAEFPEKYEHPILRKDGQQRIISWNGIALRDEKGNPAGILSSGEDITEQRALERKMLDAMLQGQEQERERLARELHDGLGVTLSSVKANLGSLEPAIDKIGEERKAYFLNSLSLLDEAIYDIRTIISDLSPRILENLGLTAALKDLCHRIDQTHKFSMKFYSSGMEERLSKPLEKTLYRIAQELINNAVKYSKASSIIVQLIRHGNLLTLTVEDNGIGFDTKYLFAHDGRGFKNIATRAKQINGVFHVDSAIGNGTLASVEVPVS